MPDRFANKEFMESLLQNIPNMIFVKDANSLRFVWMNKEGEKLLGIPLDDLVGKTDYDFFSEDEADFFTLYDRKVIETGQDEEIQEETIKTKTGETRILHTKKVPIYDKDGSPRYLLGISDDVTERRRIAETLAEAQKTKVVAHFASGVAQDLNNLLMPIIINSQMMLAKPNVEGELYQDVETMAQCAREAMDLVERMISVGKKSEGQKTHVDLCRIVRDSKPLLSSILGKKQKLELKMKAKSAKISGNRSQIEQLLANLVMNARDAMPEKGKLKIEVSNGLKDVDRKKVFYLLSVKDNGKGIARKDMSQLFKPFFTTKTLEKGSGLGLFTSKVIVQEHQGTIHVDSEEGKGTEFRILIPSCQL